MAPFCLTTFQRSHPVKIITRTGYGSLLQTDLLLGKPITYLPNSTLNEALQIAAGTLPEAGRTPTLNAYVIGRGGHRNELGADGFPLTSPIQHRPTDANCYIGMPFLIRPMTQDLSQAERNRYGLRVVMPIKGQNRITYWAKRIDLTGVTPKIYYNKVLDGSVTRTEFFPDNSNLHPIAPAMPPVGTVTTSGDYLTTEAILSLDLNANDVAELINVAKIMHDDERYAIISEIGLVTSSLRLMSGQGAGNTEIQYTEMVQAQVACFMTGYYPVGFTNLGFNMKVALGATEPMFRPSPVVSGG